MTTIDASERSVNADAANARIGEVGRELPFDSCDWIPANEVPGPGSPAAVVTEDAIFRGKRGWRLRCAQWLPRPVEELFPFFADAGNLERITPKTVQFKIATEGEIEMRAGALIEYRLRVRGVPIKWKTEIAAWQPGVDDSRLDQPLWRFVDEQLKGPYRWWVHEHRFTPMERDGVMGTRCDDRVEYGVPGGPLSPIAHALLVKRDVASIFGYRGDAMNELFAR